MFLSLHYKPNYLLDRHEPYKKIFSELATSVDADFVSFGLVITVFTYFESLGQMKENTFETSTNLTDLSMISDFRSVGICPQYNFFSSVAHLEKFYFAQFGSQNASIWPTLSSSDS